MRTANAEAVSVSLDAADGKSAAGQSLYVTVSVPKVLATSGTGFRFDLPEQVLKAIYRKQIKVLQEDGRALPSWMRFTTRSKQFVATAVPADGLPLNLKIQARNLQVVVQISEKSAN